MLSLVVTFPKYTFMLTTFAPNHPASQHTLANLSTVALLPVSSDVPLSLFAEELRAALAKIGLQYNALHALTRPGPTLHLSSDTIAEQCGCDPSSAGFADEYRLISWLGQQVRCAASFQA